MDPHFLVFGQLTREYVLPPDGPPRLDVPGGSLLYAAAGLRVWEGEVALGARVGRDYPQAWLDECRARGMDIRGIRVLQNEMDVREFLAYSESFEASRLNPVSHFARLEMTFPKSLLGYQPPDEKPVDRTGTLSVTDIPSDYVDARAAHLCPMDIVTQTQLIAGLKRGSVSTFTLDPAPGTMSPAARRELPARLNGVTAFMPSQEELRNLFWGAKHDLWQMAEAVSLYGCEYVVIKCGARGQMLYDSNTKRRWEVPAYPARVVDPTGAGDAFCGGFLAGYCRDYDPLEGVLYGNVSASLKLEGSGAFYSLDVLPGLAEARLNALRDMVKRV